MTNDKTNGFATSLKEYVEIQIRILKLQLTEKLSESGSFLASFAIIVLAGFVMTLFLSLALAYYLSNLFESYIYGLTAVGAFYLLLTIFLIAFRRKLLGDPLKDKIIRELLAERQNDEI